MGKRTNDFHGLRGTVMYYDLERFNYLIFTYLTTETNWNHEALGAWCQDDDADGIIHNKSVEDRNLLKPNNILVYSRPCHNLRDNLYQYPDKKEKIIQRYRENPSNAYPVEKHEYRDFYYKEEKERYF